MKNYKHLIFVVILSGIFLAPSIVLSAGPEETYGKFSSDKLSQIEANLVVALTSENIGLQTSAANVLKQVRVYAPEYNFTGAIIPLMQIVKNEIYDVNARVAAALALHDLKSERGDFAIKRTAIFSDTEQVRHICKHLASERIAEKYSSTR